MKDFRQANRGRAFEEFVRYANQRYDQTGLAMIEKIPTEFIPIRDRSGRICTAKVEHKSTVDFIGRYKNHPIAMEAKNATDTMRFDRIEPHQFEYLTRFNRSEGVITLVLVSFNLRRFYAIPWEFWQAAYEERVLKGNRTTNLTVNAYGVVWEIPKKLSFRADDVPDVFEVPSNDRKYGLHYLINADKYIKGESE